MFENIVIGNPDMGLHHLFAYNEKDWEEVEKSKTLFTNERFLPKLLVDSKVVKSNSEVRRNRPELVKALNDRDFLRVKWGKKLVFIAVFPEK